MRKVLISSLVVASALMLALGALLLPMAGEVKAYPRENLQLWFNANGYDIDVVADELSSIEMFEGGVYRVVIVDGEHGFVNPTGWYNTEGEYLIFSEPISEGDSEYLTSAEDFGFFIDAGDPPPPPRIRYYTETALNPDGEDHALVFHNKKIGEEYSTGYIVAFEDLSGLGDEDYDDRILEIWQDTDQDGIPDVEDNCPTVPNPEQEDQDGDGVGDACDGCPDDPNKTEPGICGCGVADTDSDGDGTADCNDGCPSDPNKTEPGECGCGVADTDSDGDGTPDCNDNCWYSPNPDQLDSNANCPPPPYTSDPACGDACEQAACTDEDEDSYSVEGGACGPIDCDDNDPNTYPGAPEVCDGKDNDCDGSIDEGCPPPPVGGTIIPTDKAGLVMPWIMAAALIVVAGASLALWNRKWGAERPSGH